VSDQGALIRPLVDSHLALIASAVLVAFSGLRVYFFAGFDISRALTILSVANQTNIAVSSLLFLVAAFCPSLLIWPRTRRWLFAGNATGARAWLQLRTALVWIPLVCIIASALTVALVAGVLVAYLLVKIALRRRTVRAQRGDGGGAVPGSVAGFSWLYATFVGFSVLLAMLTPWQAKESVTIRSADKPIVGYIMGEQAGDLLIVGPKKSLRWVPVNEVASRDMCKDPDSPWYLSRLGALAIPASGVECQ